MNKIGIIIKREYLSRVSKKSFILTTLGIPLLMIAFGVIIGILQTTTTQTNKIAVIDQSKIFENKLWDSSKNNQFVYFDEAQKTNLQIHFTDSNYDMYMHIMPIATQGLKPEINIYSDAGLSYDQSHYLNKRINDVYQNKVMQDAGMNQTEIDSINNLQLEFKNITKEKNTTSSELAMGIGYASGFIIYIVMFVYGMMVMRGVMEEKTNRIAEVIVSSVKPFELMMGKVVGIALVGLTQFVIWIVFSGILTTIISGYFGINTKPTMATSQQIPPSELASIFTTLASVNWFKILTCFVLYFMGGYFLYASIFAAIGSLVNEDANEAQSLTMPITMPIIIGIIIAMQASKDPNSTLAVVGSIFPLTSPMVMMARIAYNPPMWQVVLSLVLLIATFIGTIWLGAKIYRIGILMYGKKPTWKEIIKWL